ncbi:hypothetical protein QAD02_019625 [Eretmocerus hayati]|uniref:Uncharacterized protein n=1 Tax=Eretmocerus hayati TaxID=131215 RepID=A0ACC2PLB2_9HYME|nr:hypothetical protein QAD02_019625 [Eretmocerus hayati]
MEALDSVVVVRDYEPKDNGGVHYNFTNDFAMESLDFQICMGCLYSIVFIVGVFGNALVAFVVIRNVHMRTVTNIFIANLAFSDILLCFLGIPFTPLYTFMETWSFGGPMCYLLTYSQGVSIYISTFTLTSIAADRFHVILFPLRPRMKTETCVFIVVAIWIAALILTLPYGLNMKFFTQDGIDYCEEEWTESDMRIFSTFTTTLQFVIPFLIIAICYGCVSVRLNRRTKNRPGCSNSRREEADRERNRKTNRMLIAMVVVFAVCWMPLNLCNIVIDFNTEIENWRYYKAFFFIAHLIAMSSTCYNPFLYAWLNENFKKEFKLVSR